MSFYDGIPWAIAVVGWGATHLFSEARERRKEVRAQLDKIYEHLYKLEQDAKAFHCSKGFDAAKSGEIVSKIALIERTLARIPLLTDSAQNQYMIDLRRSITLDNFDASTFVPQTQTSEIVQNINTVSLKLEYGLETQYRDQYPHTAPYIKLKYAPGRKVAVFAAVTVAAFAIWLWGMGVQVTTTPSAFEARPSMPLFETHHSGMNVRLSITRNPWPDVGETMYRAATLRIPATVTLKTAKGFETFKIVGLTKELDLIVPCESRLHCKAILEAASMPIPSDLLSPPTIQGEPPSRLQNSKDR